MEVVLAGASGLIGSALKAGLRAAGHEVKVLVRQPDRSAGRGQLGPGRTGGSTRTSCRRRRRRLPVRASASATSAGPSPTSSRSCAAGSTRSRTDRAHARRVRRAPRSSSARRPSATTATPATGPSTSSRRPATRSWPASVEQWEAAADPARAAGVRVAHPRTGLVLAKDGDLLKRLEPDREGRGRGQAGQRPPVHAVDLAGRRGRRAPVPARARRRRTGQPHRPRTR